MAVQIEATQRRHSYSYALGALRHSPVDADSVTPSAAVPTILGLEALRGGDGFSDRGTAWVSSLVALAEPPAFAAVTRTCRVRRASDVPTVYWDAVAPPTGSQSSPSRSQRLHWYE
jgi:hypothetical protein